MRKTVSLGLLVLANILATMVIFAAAAIEQFVRPFAFFLPSQFALTGFVAAQLLLLAMVTAFHDPRTPLARWLSIAVILFGAFTVFALEGAVIWSLMRQSYGWMDIQLWLLRVRELLFTSSLFATISLSAALSLVLALHIVAWPLRATFGWRLVRKGEAEAAANARQFGITHLLAWVGLSAALMWLITTANRAGELAVAFAAIIVVAAISILFVAPWVYLLIKQRIRYWPIVATFAAMAAICYVVQEAISQINAYQILNSRSVAAIVLIPSLQFLELFGYSGAITLATVVNLVALRKMGFRFQSAKSGSPQTAVVGASQANIAAPGMAEASL